MDVIGLHLDNRTSMAVLMAFYLKHGEFILATKCYHRVVTHDPDYPRVWICYALMKEMQWREAKNSLKASSERRR